MNNIVLSIAIPTYNRAEWLKLCLSRLIPQLEGVYGEVEVTIYDNASPDHTADVAKSFLVENLPITYIRNSENIGSDKNIAQCFNKAIGRYVLILGDDDVVLDGSLKKIIEVLNKKQYDHGAIYMRAYGYDNNYCTEKPFQFFRQSKVYSDADEFMCKCSSGMAFISSLIINKSKIATIDANQFIGTALVQTYLFYEAVRSAKTNYFIDEYFIAAKRIEQRDYDVTKVFGTALNDALDHFVTLGLSKWAVKRINRKLIWYFFPIFLMQLRSGNSPIDAAELSYEELTKRYSKEPLFWICSAPILKLPSQFAILWGAAVIVCSRLINGEFGRLWVAVRQKLTKKDKV
jgi:glycosyltransferase involved in cell wall biosynthesis